MSSATMDEETGPEGIAIIGMAGRFPGSPDVDCFWQNLLAGNEAVVRFEPEQLTASGVPEAEWQAQSYVPMGAPLADYACFDAAFFSFTPREAEVLDPQQRIFLETAYHALEDAGYVPGNLPDRVGVFAGSRFSDYLIRHIYGNRALLDQVGHFQALLSNDKDYLTPLLSYKLDLGGPSVVLQTACSTSLVAVHFAAESLLSHNCNLALAGAVTLRLPMEAGYHYQPGGIFSPTGHCRAFDAKADGTVFGNGVGLVVLKRLEDALADEDQIYGLLLGSAVNNDGARKVGLTAPAAEGQARVIADALAIADLDPEAVSYLECHGTGTQLGDAIELAALTKVFKNSPKRSCAIGSVKTNIGHLEAAAGIAGLIKVMLMLKHRQLVPSLHFETPNPQIGFDSGPFFVQTETCAWPDEGSGRVAALSSFGIGGTNAHLILGEAPEPEPKAAKPLSSGPVLLQLSAKDPAALARMAKNLGQFLESHPDLVLADVAATLRFRREQFQTRLSLVAQTTEEAATLLLREEGARGQVPAKPPSLVFLFPGQGSQYPGMGHQAYLHYPVFREAIDSGARYLEPQLGRDIRSLLFATPEDRRARAELDATELTQPALFLVSYAFAQLWRSWGAVPSSCLGHSVGEYVAACLAGVFTFQEALSLVVQRGKLVARCATGSMVSVQASLAALQPLLGESCELAAFNAPLLNVVSGPDPAIEVLCQKLEAAEISFSRLYTSHAFHSASLDPILAEFRAYLGRLKLNPPKIPFVSNLTGTWITPAQAVSPEYWVQHLRKPVRFLEGLQTLAQSGPVFFLEVGPGRSASSMARASLEGCLAATSQGTASEFGPTNHKRLLEAVGRLWLAGLQHGPETKGDFVRLPGYPFARTRHWVAASPQGPGAFAEPVASSAPTNTVPANQRPESLLSTYVAPETDRERALAAIWESALGVAPIGRHDDFFELGGHSLLATRVLARLRHQLGLELQLQDFFEGASLARLAREATAVQSDEPQLRRLGAQEPPRLTPAQERFWFLYQLAPRDPSYNLPGAFPLDGPCAPVALEHALYDLAQRHEILRWSFPSLLGQPTVAVQAEMAVPLTLIDLSMLRGHDQKAALAHLRRRDAWTPFSLDRGPLFRTTLVRLSENRHVFLMNLHHIICDGGSFTVLNRDLGQFLRARLQGETTILERLPFQYGDFAAWHRAKLGPERLAQLDAYWSKHLAGVPLVFDLETDYPRPGFVDARGARAGIRLDADVTAALHRVARANQAGMFMVLMTAFQVLMWHRSGKSQFLVGTDVTHRTHRDLEALVGLFVNQIVLRAQLGTELTLQDLLKQVRAEALAAFAHQDLPFERLVELLKPERDLSRTPLYQIRFVFQNHPPLQPGQATFSGADLDEKDIAVRHDLRLEMGERDGRLEGFLEYRTALFAPETMTHLASQYMEIVRRIAYCSEQRLQDLVRDLPHLDPNAARLLRGMLHGGRPPVTGLFPDWLAASTQAWPDRLALACDDEPLGGYPNLDYAALMSCAEQLARRLRAQGVGPDSVVALYMERSVALFVAILAVWKAGGAFLPLDLKAPAPWLRQQIEQAGCQHVLTLVCWRESLQQAELPATTILVDRAATEANPAEALLPSLLPDQLAYVLFTSGSTGAAKAVGVTHSGLAHYALGLAERCQRIGGHWAYVLSVVGDSGLSGLVLPWMLGGCIHAIRPETVNNPEAYLAYTARFPMDGLKVMPSVLKAMQAGGRFSEILPERCLILGGEHSEISWIRAMSAAKPGCLIYNHFGITETTVGNVLCRLDGPMAAGFSSVPMGQPLAHVQAYLVDGFDRPVAPGMSGELHIAGPYLARGYLGQPTLTALRFRPDPWSKEPGARRYLAGDLVYYDEQGYLYFRGRADHQIKLRGFRVEPGDVENHLRQTGLVRQAVVRLIKGERPYLVAYVVPKLGEDGPGFEEQLRQALVAKLPGALIPSVFVLLEQFPQLPNGKLDLKALPVPTQDQSASEREAETPMERQLAAIWCQVLGIERVGADDNFFKRGGDSLLCIRVIALANRIGLALNTEAFFRNQTLAEQARWLETQDPSQGERALVGLQPGGQRTPIFCIHAAGGMIYNYLELSRALGPDQPFFALQDPAFMGLGVAGASIETMAARYLAEILQVSAKGPFRLAGHSMGGLIAFELALRLEALGHQVESVVLFDTRAPGRIPASSEDDERLLVLGHLLEVMFKAQNQKNPLKDNELRECFGQERLEKASAAIRQLPGCSEFTATRIGTVVETYLAHVQAARAYQGREYRGQVTLFRPQSEIREDHELSGGWSTFAPSIEVIAVQGDHTTMLTRAHIQEIATRM